MIRQFTLGKQERLKSRKQIEHLFNEGKNFSIAPFRIHYSIRKSAMPPMQFGVGVSTKNFKKAVDRNRIKRMVREAYRLQKFLLYQKLNETKGQLIVFFIFNGKEIPAYHEITEKMKMILDKLAGFTDSSK
ncbi:MAG: ribonuclease P protein component [Chitinophagaceae bacterium]